MSKPAVKGISGSRIHRKRAFETPSDEQTSVGVHAGLNCVYFEAQGKLIDEKTSEIVSPPKTERAAILRTITVNRQSSKF